ncbi:MAG: TRAP transporter substrate-binding protein DctP [Myxococcota bacterium]
MTLKKPTRRTFLRTSTAAAGVAAVGAPLIAKGEAKHTLKIASLAPDGSSWAKAFKMIAREVKARSDGAIKMQVYVGGVMGDEPAMIRKCRTGQLDGAAVTSVGLGEINKQVLMMQFPMLFSNYKQVDRVREKMKPSFEKLFADGGFHLSNWGDVGFLYPFSNTPVASPSDLKSTKFWVWDADPVTKVTAEVAGVNGVELSVPDVLPSLQTGVIDACASSPYALISLQWYSKIKYVTNLRMAMGLGASVISQKSFGKLSDDHKQLLMDVSNEYGAKLVKRIRKDNKKAVATLTEKGVQVVEPTNMDEWKAIAKGVRKKLVGSTFDADLVAEMDSYL